MTNNVRYGLVALAALALPTLPMASAAEIPSGLDLRGQVGVSMLSGQAGLPAEDPGIKPDALDAVEHAELARSDPAQRGGDHDARKVTTVALVVAIVILLLFL